MKRSTNNAPPLTSKICSYLICLIWLAVMGWNVKYFLNSQDISNIENISKIHLPNIKSIHFNIRDVVDGTLESPYLRSRNEESDTDHDTDHLTTTTAEDRETETKYSSQVDKSEPPIHVVFSTDCSFFQDWQTIVVFFSAVQVRQQGEITRIASGCDEDKKKELTALYQKLYPQFHVHFTPDFKTDGHSKKKYDFYNKPFGMHHWLEHAHPPIPDGTIIMLIDPDFVFLRPLNVHFGDDNNLIPMKNSNPNFQYPTRYGKGQAVAQLYGLGAPWTNPNSNQFNKTEICGEGSPCLDVTNQFGEEHYSVGPPYILEKSDFLRLTRTWTEYVPRVYKKYPELLAEMFAYSMAAAHEKLPHATYEHFMVSNTHMYGEGWPFIDILGDDVCVPPVDGLYYPTLPMPTFLHFCQFFRIGELGFQKRRLPKSLFQCDKPLMADTPIDLPKLDYKNRDGEIIKLNRQEARRNAFAMCVLHQTINAAVINYRNVICGNTTGAYNTEKSVNLALIDY